MKPLPLRKRRWRPTQGCYLSLALVSGVSFLLALGERLYGGEMNNALGRLLLLAGLITLILDYLLSRQLPPVLVERRLPGSLAVNLPVLVHLDVRHNFRHSVPLRLFDAIPSSVEQHHLPLDLRLLPGKTLHCSYELRPLERGLLTLEPCFVEVTSPLGLWRISYRSGMSSQVKIYPDFMAVSVYTLLATDNHTSQLGIKRKPRRGTGLEFQQLREYRRGDSLRQVDWKATSRRQNLVSREYQDERDQQIVLLVDSGRRMRAKDGNLSHFDHALNAVLLLSYIALRQGDSVSVMSFGATHRWIPPQKGVDSIKHLLNGMYDLQASNCAPDYTAAAEKLVLLQRKRSMVILVTNSRDDDNDELLLAANLLRRRHLVLIANIREEILDLLIERPITDFDTALTYAGTEVYLAKRAEAQRKIKAAGIFSLDCTAKELAKEVANAYLAIKSAGVL